MTTESSAASCSPPQSRNWIDRAAIAMAVVCGIHCLVTPILLVLLPVIGTTFWVNGDFHLWMLVLVVPTTVLAAFSGCRKHRDRMVAICTTVGLLFLISATAREILAADSPYDADLAAASLWIADSAQTSACTSCCALDASHEGEKMASLGNIPLTTGALLNLAGGLFLIVGHARNFRLCRVSRCCDGVDEALQ